MSQPGPTELNLLDRRILRIVAAAGLFELDFRDLGTLPAASNGSHDAGTDGLNRNPARLFAAIDGEDDPALIESHVALFAESENGAPLAALVAGRFADVTADDLARFEVIIARTLDARDFARLGQLVEPELDAGNAVVVTAAGDIHPAIAPSKWVFVTLRETTAQRMTPLWKFLHNICSSEFDPVELQYTVFQAKARLREQREWIEAVIEERDREMKKLEMDHEVKLHRVETLWTERMRRLEAEVEDRLRQREAALRADQERFEAEQNRRLDERDVHIRNLEANHAAHVASLEADRDTRLADLTARHDEQIAKMVAEFREQLAKAERDYRIRVEQLETDRDLRFAHLESERVNRANRIQSLESELAESRRKHESAERALGETLGSRSWRLTAPLRAMMKILR